MGLRRPNASHGLTHSMEKHLQLITATQSFLLPLPAVHRIIARIPAKPLPLVPDYIRGVIHFEGQLWIVLDLDEILGEHGADGQGEMVLVKQEGFHLAFMVHRTVDIVTVDPDRREKRGVPGLPESCVDFVTVIGGTMYHCLNLSEFIKEFSVK